MVITEDTTAPLRKIWGSVTDRQASQLVLLQAIAQSTELSVKESDEILNALDSILLEEEVEERRTANQGM